MFLNEIEAEYQYLNGPPNEKPNSPIRKKFKPYDFLHTTSDVIPLPIHEVEQKRIARRQRMLAEAQATLATSSAVPTSGAPNNDNSSSNSSSNPIDEKKITSALQFAARLGITKDDLCNAVTGEHIVEKDESWRSYFGDPEDVLYQNLQRRLVRFVEDETYLKKEDFIQDEMKKDIIREAALKKFSSID